MEKSEKGSGRHVPGTLRTTVAVEGEIMPNDVAKKGNISCLVILTGECPP